MDKRNKKSNWLGPFYKSCIFDPSTLGGELKRRMQLKEKELRAEEQLRSEKEKLKQDSQQHLAALENIVKEHNLNMVRTNELVTALPKVKKGKQSKHQL